MKNHLILKASKLSPLNSTADKLSDVRQKGVVCHVSD